MKNKEKIVGAVAILIISIIALALGYFSGNEKEEYNEVFSPISAEIKENDNKELVEEKQYIVVDIKGAVKNPKEYILEKGARIRDLIDMAGGLTEEADENRIYYSKILSDEDCIRVYKIGEAIEEGIEENNSSGSSSGINAQGKVNINKATMEELQTLPGIGEVKAKSIIEYREAQKGFGSIEELGNITGIGAKTLEKLRDMVDIK